MWKHKADFSLPHCMEPANIVFEERREEALLRLYCTILIRWRDECVFIVLPQAVWRLRLGYGGHAVEPE